MTVSDAAPGSVRLQDEDDGFSTAVEQPVPDLSAALTATLPVKGLDRMTSTRVELVLCTSALTAHI